MGLHRDFIACMFEIPVVGSRVSEALLAVLTAGWIEDVPARLTLEIKDSS